MTALPSANEDRRLERAPAGRVQTYARIVGVLFLVSFIAGGFGEMYVPSKILVSGDASATARNILASEALFRLGFASYLVEALCDVTLALLLYALLRPVHRDLALLGAFFRIVATVVFCTGELFCFAALPILKRADQLAAFAPDQVAALALFSLKLYNVGTGVSMVFYGVPTAIFGYLVWRSGYLPRVLGALLALAGLCFVAFTFLLVLAPAYATSLLYVPMMVAGVPFAVWLLAKGVDVPKWEAMARAR